MPRLFAGIELPEDIQDMLADLETPIPGVRWLEGDALHMTLRFAGDIDNRAAADLADELSRIEVRAFDMRLKGLGTFGAKEPRALWAGVEAGPQLESLARACERAARNAGLAPETRAFKPHVTIARLKNPRIEALARFLARHGAFQSPTFVINRFVLLSSRPKVGGGPYIVEDAYPLEGGEVGFAEEADRW
jgi:2'-5' RNA ligase